MSADFRKPKVAFCQIRQRRNGDMKIKIWVKSGHLCGGSDFQQASLQVKSRPTKRAPDVWDSAAFSGIFLASSFSCSQAESTSAPAPVTQTVGLLLAKENLLKIDVS